MKPPLAEGPGAGEQLPQVPGEQANVLRILRDCQSRRHQAVGWEFIMLWGLHIDTVCATRVSSPTRNSRPTDGLSGDKRRVFPFRDCTHFTSWRSGLRSSASAARERSDNPLTERPGQTLKMPGLQPAALFIALGRVLGLVRRWRIPEKG